MNNNYSTIQPINTITNTILVNGVPTQIDDTQMVVKSLMSQQEIVINKDTPICCNPSTETFWSM
jgi:hypothetical protein